MILLFTSNNIASHNIAKKLIEKHNFEKKAETEWEKNGVKLIDTKAPTVLDIPTDFSTDCIIVLSSHKSKVPKKRLTVHLPGNWGAADFGGEPRTLNIADASRMKILIQEITKEAKRIGWEASLEVDHHGPTCNIPILFVEIGSSEKEWKDEKAAEAVANALSINLKRNEKYETVFGIGGGHYARDFTELTLETDIAVGHIAPKYVLDEIDENTFRQAIEKNVEKVERVLILKEETNSSQKKTITKLAEKFLVRCEMV